MSPAICVPGSASGLGTSPSATGWNLGAQRRDRKLWTTISERVEADVAVLQLTLVELEEILKQLMGIALPNPRIRGDEVATLISTLAQILPLSSGLLCSEFTRFVQKCCCKERVLFSSPQLRVVMEFFLNFIKVCPSWYTASSIRALGQVLHDNADRASHEFELLFAVLLKHLDPAGVDIEARYAATSCVSNICTQAGKTPEVYHYFSSLLRMVVENFRQQAQSLIKGQNERILVKACTCSMKCVFTIINSNFDRLGDRIAATLPTLLSSMRQVVGYGLVLKCDSDDVVFSYQEELHPNDSDSSVCGSDGGGSRQVGDGLLARLRVTVLYTLEAIAQHFPKAITSSMDHGVRMASLSCMSALLNIQDTLPAILEWMVQTSDTDRNVCTTPGPEVIGESGTPPLPLPAPTASLVDKAEVVPPLLPLTPPSQVLYELLPAYQLRLVIEKMLVYINDNDKVASSVARTLGLVCRWISFPPFRSTLSTPKDRAWLDDLLGQAMVVLAGKINAGSPKVRWNACHAIAKVLLCPSLPLASVTWAPTVFQALLTAVAQQENFKVRISAATALRVSHTRSAFGSFFQLAVRATVDALETASDLKDVTEFRYKEQLETQLSFTLVHLIHISTEEDDPLILEALKAKPRGFLYDWLLHNLHRMVATIERESDTTATGSTSGGDLNEEGRAGGTGDAHDVNPIKKEELLSAVRSLLRILDRLNTDKAYANSCISLLYDTKIGLEHDVLYSNEDIPFEL
ncbi:hypothetical protein BBO99_00003265 [Phytophthora kernoviae]|uniref:DUF4042 domain-containing protein n=2 Tax=Phytophthora kernoviae TaxID=325452 RepID=A0A3R7MNC9_9STRA|nr:hypothetical protein G195_004832 [Phytophthora kernoviae 00238/432]KAG2525948.1 hypothetical protein JM16_004149 [Phytophthora kernoviae]KAG2527649.1 hypothetical protein JM18_003623 [Phytophthora kernoviae]RLN14189.1 hypothetical protein BBI17_004441 [Phytophthora kernoviae]RLN81932.1 hypothetical protein BBO99_00003265 [Phytophthora kernoviae]